MPKFISTTEAKDNFDSIFAWVDKHHEVIIEQSGTPRVVIVSHDTFKEIESLREQVGKLRTFTKLQALVSKVQKRNSDLTPKEAHRLADRFVREVIDEMVQEEKL